MTARPILSQSTVSLDGKWEGWCWYPDQPSERAVVEIFCGNRSIKAVRAARLRTDIRDLGMGDGYCGFQLPLPSLKSLSEHAVWEVRERRFGQVIGRVVFGDDDRQLSKETSLAASADVLRSANAKVSTLATGLSKRAAPLEELGAILSQRRHCKTRLSSSLRNGALAVCQYRIRDIAHADFGYCRNPLLTLVVQAFPQGYARSLRDLADELCFAAKATRAVGTEIILLDERNNPLTQFLPTRLKHLRLVQWQRNSPIGGGLNAAALTARGKWLAFAKPGTGVAHIVETVKRAVDGTSYFETVAAEHSVSQNHRLHSLVGRHAYVEIGGADPNLEQPDVWTDLTERAALLKQKIVTWKTNRGSGVQSSRNES